MHIKKLSIEGYRCFSEHFEINFRKGLNVIVGENGAGKTSIINSFRQLDVQLEKNMQETKPLIFKDLMKSN
ncbi:AAA family ATPase [Acinetobacter sp. LF10]|uniref:AAA family ATPase n=1 Tax=Acinetobacter TaxID=469 RepID=UPI00226F193D|nr:AAA family ATPase [Acinetobacter pittii]